LVCIVSELVLSEKSLFHSQSAEIRQPMPRNSRHLIGKLQQQAGSGAVGEDLYLGGAVSASEGNGVSDFGNDGWIDSGKEHKAFVRNVSNNSLLF